MNMLIIGGDSYVGRSFIRYTGSPISIRTVSRKSTGHKNELVLKDLTKIPDEEFKNAEIVFNCAAIVHKKNVPDNLYMDINYALVRKLASDAKKFGVRKFIQMSTIAVYGNCEYIDHETKENPIGPYGESKLFADEALITMQDPNFSVIILRTPMIYGPDAPGNMKNLIKFVRKSILIPFKNIDNQRDFIFIENLVLIIEKAIQRNLSGKLIVSDGDPVSTEEIVNLIIKNLEKKRIIISFPFLKLLNYFRPLLYWKLFGDSKVDNSISIKKLNLILPYSFNDGMGIVLKNFSKKNS